jgi:hypothetical protein
MKTWSLVKPIDRLESLLGLEGPNHFYISDENGNILLSAKEVYFPGFFSRLKRAFASTASFNSKKDYEIDLRDDQGRLKARLLFDNGGVFDRQMKWVAEEGKETLLFTQSDEIPATGLRMKSDFPFIKIEFQINEKTVCIASRKVTGPTEFLLEASRYQLQFLEDLAPKTTELLIASLIFNDIKWTESSEAPKSVLGYLLTFEKWSK